MGDEKAVPLFQRIRDYYHGTAGPDPLAVDNAVFQVKRIEELARLQVNLESENLELRIRAENLHKGVGTALDAVGRVEGRVEILKEILRKAYAPLRNAHRKAEPKHRDVVLWSVGMQGYCPTCDVLRQMQSAIEAGEGAGQ